MVIVPTNVPAEPLAGVLVITEVNSAEHARVGNIVRDTPEIGIGNDDLWCIGMPHGDRMTAAAVCSLHDLTSARRLPHHAPRDNLGSKA